MDYLRLDSEILSSVQYLNGAQKSEVLDYIKNISKNRHNTKLYRRKAMKEIKEAIRQF